MNNNVSITTNVFWKFAERIFAQLISFVVSIILARLLLPKDYGAVALVMVFIAVANVFVTSGIPTALIQKKDADELDFSSVFFFNIGFSIILYLIIFFAAEIIAKFYKNDILVPVLRILGLRIILAGINSVQHAYVSRKMIFKKYFWSTFFGTALSGIVGIAMAYMGFGVWALVAQYLINTTVDTIILSITVEWRPKLIFSWKRVKELFKFGWKILFEGLSNTFYEQITNLIIGGVYSSEDLAFYTKGQQFPSLIVNNISISISSVLLPAMSNEQEDKSKVVEILRKSVKVSSYVVFPILFGLAAVSSNLIPVLLTDKWNETIPYLIGFCILTLPTIGMIPRHQALNSTGRSDVFMIEHILSRLVALIILIFTYKISVMAILMGSLVSSLILTLTIAFTSKKFNGYRYRDQILDILPICIGCILMSVPVYFLSYLNLPSVVALIIQVICGILIYLVYSIIFKLEGFTYCKNYLIRFFKKIKKTEA